MPTKSLKERQAEMRARMATRRPAFSAERIIAPALVEAPQATETVESIAIPNVEGNTVSRADLYALVWAEPIVKVAKRFGVSDVAVAKACRRHLIPMPRRAFWKRLRAGQRLGRVPLPESSEPHLQQITFSGGKPADTNATQPTAEIAFERQPENRIAVAPELTDPHRLVRRTRTILRGARKDENGLLRPIDDALDVRISNSQVDRALRIMDALVKALAMRGHEVSVVPETEEQLLSTRVEVAGTQIYFGSRKS
jgi:hypothetical protein